MWKIFHEGERIMMKTKFFSYFFFFIMDCPSL